MVSGFLFETQREGGAERANENVLSLLLSGASPEWRGLKSLGQRICVPGECGATLRCRDGPRIRSAIDPMASGFARNCKVDLKKARLLSYGNKA